MRQIFMWWKSETALLNCKLFFAGELAEWGRILSTNTQNCLNLPVNVNYSKAWISNGCRKRLVLYHAEKAVGMWLML